jgi:hypothetical protein
MDQMLKYVAKNIEKTDIMISLLKGDFLMHCFLPGNCSLPLSLVPQNGRILAGAITAMFFVGQKPGTLGT